VHIFINKTVVQRMLTNTYALFNTNLPYLYMCFDRR